jgi:hypothetical protein
MRRYIPEDKLFITTLMKASDLTPHCKTAYNGILPGRMYLLLVACLTYV